MASAPTAAQGFRGRDFPDAIKLSRNMSPSSIPCRLEEVEGRFTSFAGDAGSAANQFAIRVSRKTGMQCDELSRKGSQRLP